MPELETAKSDHESSHGPQGSHGGGAADPPSGMGEWWKTPPSLVGPPAVDPAIYGIEPSDVGVDHGGGLDAYIGMSGAASAQAAPIATRGDHMRASEHNRAATMSAQMMLAARKIEASIAEIEVTVNAPLGARSADGIYAHLESLMAAAIAERTRMVMVFREQKKASLEVPIAGVTNALEHLGRASHDLALAEMKVARFASQHQLGVNANRPRAKSVTDDFDRVEEAFGTQVNIAGVKKVSEKESKLKLDSLEESLEGLDESTTALVMAMREAKPETAMKEVLPRLLSNHRMLKASLVDEIKPTTAMLTRGKRIVAAIQTAWRDARPLELQVSGDLKNAFEQIPPTITDLEELAKKK